MHPASYSDNGVDTRGDVLLRSIITLTLMCYRIPATAAFATLAIIVNAAVAKSMRGTMNGLIMMAGSFGNGAGPIAGSALYAFALDIVYPHPHDKDHERSWLPVDGRVVFLLTGVLAVALAIFAKISMKVPGTV